jgi:hypothetical protein
MLKRACTRTMLLDGQNALLQDNASALVSAGLPGNRRSFTSIRMTAAL